MVKIRFSLLVLATCLSLASLRPTPDGKTGRGIVALRCASSAYVGWRLLGTDAEEHRFQPPALGEWRGSDAAQQHVDHDQLQLHRQHDQFCGLQRLLHSAGRRQRDPDIERAVRLAANTDAAISQHPLATTAGGTTADGVPTYMRMIAVPPISTVMANTNHSPNGILSNSKDNSQSGFTGKRLSRCVKIERNAALAH